VRARGIMNEKNMKIQVIGLRSVPATLKEA
jgi:hypothetical protein